MLKKIGFPLVALLALFLLIPTPQAKAGVHFGIGIGVPAYPVYPAYPAYGYADPYGYYNYSYPAYSYPYVTPVYPNYSYGYGYRGRRYDGDRYRRYEHREHERREFRGGHDGYRGGHGRR
jgi:hypothetical protein